jgi:vacuolar-type H+-ATPase subunit F/Vma7
MTQKKIVVLGSNVLPLGMKLAGVKEGYSVDNNEDAERILMELFERKDVGIIVMTESLSRSIKDRRVRYRMENSIDPVVVSVPGYQDKVEVEETLRRLILRAMGIDIAETSSKK